ncbi:hypothetical protein B0H11DRAFT_2223873 [Mycena galericulata]|nr:hypothetical protein B0H11DRAFT_2223873 [Mycena galericulata]
MHWNYNLVRSVRVIQVELRVLAVTSILEPNSCWKTLTPAVREAHMLEGLFRTCLREPVHMPNTRMYTSDITLASMETDNGEGFLTLLKKYVPDEASVMSGGSTSYLHPGWTKESIERLENAGHAAGVQIWIALRDSFLVSFLYNTISSVVGIPRVIKSDDNESTPLHWGTRICEGCGDREGNGARFSPHHSLEMDDMEEEEDEANDFADYSPPDALKKRKVSFRVESDDDESSLTTKLRGFW